MERWSSWTYPEDLQGSGIHALFAIPKHNCTTWVVQYHAIHKYKLNNHGGYTDHFLADHEVDECHCLIMIAFGDYDILWSWQVLDSMKKRSPHSVAHPLEPRKAYTWQLSILATRWFWYFPKQQVYVMASCSIWESTLQGNRPKRCGDGRR